eukprot:403348784
MKRFLLSTLSIIGLSSANTGFKYSLESFQATQVNASPNITDYQVKGQQSVLGLQDFIFNLETNIEAIGGAKRALQAIKNLQSLSDFFASSGYAAVFPEQYGTNSVSSALTYIQGHLQWVQAYNHSFTTILSDNVNCSTLLGADYQLLQTGLAKLIQFSQTKQVNQTQAQIYAEDFINFCSNQTCEKVLYDFVMMVNNEYTYYNESCEMVQEIIAGQPELGIYRGQRDQSINMIASLLNQILLSFTVQSAYLTLSQLKLDAWKDLHETYGQQLRVVFDNIQSMDLYLQANMVHNAEYNLNFEFPAPPQPAPKLRNKDMADYIGLYLQSNYPSFNWIVAVYSGSFSPLFNFYQCTNCFAFTQFFNDYNIMVVSVDPNSTPNAKQLNSNDWRNQELQYTDSYSIVTNLLSTPTNCFQAILALIGDQDLGLNGGSQQAVYHALSDRPSGHTLVVSTNQYCGLTVTNEGESIKISKLELENAVMKRFLE